MSGRECEESGPSGRAGAGGREVRPARAPLLLSFYGIGTRLLGWTHRGDGTATATLWFTFLFLPLFPLSRHSLGADGGEAPQPGAAAAVGAALGADDNLIAGYRFTGRLPLSGGEVVATYLFAYVRLPLKLFAPLAALAAAVKLFPGMTDGTTMTPLLVFAALFFTWLGYVLFVALKLLHGSRGGVG